MAAFADQSAIAIANAKLFETVDRRRPSLSRFLSPEVAALVSSDEGAQLLAGHRAYITVAFFDLRGFTAFAETAEPEELIDVAARVPRRDRASSSSRTVARSSISPATG